MFGDDGRVGALHWQRGARWTRLNSGGIQAGGAQRGSHLVGSCGTCRSRWEAATLILESGG